MVEKIETSNLLPKFPRSCSLQDNTIAHSKVGLALKLRVLIPNQLIELQISSPFPGRWGASTPVVMITLLFAILLLTSLFIMVSILYRGLGRLKTSGTKPIMEGFLAVTGVNQAIVLVLPLCVSLQPVFFRILQLMIKILDKA